MVFSTSEIPSIAFESGGHIRFVGAKVAVFVGSQLVSLLRDDVERIPWPGHWDVLGGGREGDEGPWDCAKREAREESGLVLTRQDILWAKAYVNSRGKGVWFFVAQIDEARAVDLALQDEGQAIALMALDNYLSHAKAVPQFQQRLGDWVAGL